MKFSFKNNDDKIHAASSVQQQQQPPIEVNDVREVYPADSAAGSAGSSNTSRTAPSSYNNRGNSEDPRRMGILLFPETQDVKDFWVLYQRISNSGLKCHAGIFEQTTEGTWIEQKVE